MKIYLHYYLIRIVLVFTFIWGIALCIGVYTTYGIHLRPSAIPELINHASNTQLVFGLCFTIISIVAFIFLTKGNEIKYFDILLVPAHQFRRQSFVNAHFITFLDDNKSYAWQLNKRQYEKLNKLIIDNGSLYIKKYYTSDKKLVSVLVSFNS